MLKNLFTKRGEATSAIKNASWDTPGGPSSGEPVLIGPKKECRIGIH